MTSPSTHPARPSSVSLAQKLMYALAALAVVGFLLTLTTLDTVRAEAASLDLTEEQAVTGTLVVAGIAALISVVLWSLLGVFTGRGKNWARIVATVLAVLGLLFGLFTLGGTAIQLVVAVVTLLIYVALLVLLWRKESSAFFASGGARQTVADPGYPQA